MMDLISIQNILLFVSLVCLLASGLHLLFSEEEIVLNQQVIFLIVVYLFAALSIVWARSPERVLSVLKFRILSTTAFMILFSTIKDRTQVKNWISFLIFLSIFSIFIISAMTFLYSPTGGISIGYLRDFTFDSNINIHSITLLITFPIALHYIFHSNAVYKRFTGLMILTGGTAVIVLSGSRSPLIVLGIFICGLAVIDHTKIGWKISRYRASAVMLSSILLAVSFLLVTPSLLGRLVDQSAQELSYLIYGDPSKPGPVRSRIYIVVWNIITQPEKALVGVGFNNFGVIYSEITGQNYYPHPHNPVFKFTTELGVIGFICIILVILRPILWFFRGVSIIDDEFHKSEFTSIGWTYILLLSFGVFQPLLTRHQFYITSAIIFSTYISVTTNQSYSDSSKQ
ncbi:O-antigen ligase family protein [Halorubrum sp. ASP1]|uniref:O-antigen ligase family protein n=1 Tax=Halorubrum sp. ASP1 TaxID=2518114 RepID=UPI001F546782|nr:O-antigen ligase family protein [Halorubrum sp. ASP1]